VAIPENNGIPKIKPMPHIAGAEFAGVVEKIGDGVTSVSKGNRVAVYNRHFDGSCDMCRNGMEMLCRNGYIMGVLSNGGFSEYVSVRQENLAKLQDGTSWEIAASLPVAALTAYHAVKRGGLKNGETAVVLGASGNTGQFALQFSKEIGAKTIAVSRKESLAEFGADETIPMQNAQDRINTITNGRMADFVINSLGEKFWNESFLMLGSNGRLATFGTLTGAQVNFDISGLYSKHATLIGSTGGSLAEFKELASKANSYKVRVWKKFKLEEGMEAVKELSAPERNGRIMLEIG